MRAGPVPRAEIRQHRESGESLGAAATIQLAGDERGEHQHRRAAERRHEADRLERVAEDRTNAFRDERDAGRKVHPPELQVPAHREIEQLVAMEAVRRDRVDEEVQAKLEAGEPRHQAPGDRRSGGRDLGAAAQASETLSFSTQTLVAKNSRIMAA
jgi:hypothetical protein